MVVVPLPRLLTRAELAAELRVQPSTIWRWTRQGKIPVIQPTAKVQRYDLEDVVAALKRVRPGVPIHGKSDEETAPA